MNKSDTRMATTGDEPSATGEVFQITIPEEKSVDRYPETAALNRLRDQLATTNERKIPEERQLDAIRRLTFKLYDSKVFDDLTRWLEQVTPKYKLEIWKVWVSMILGRRSLIDCAHESMCGLVNVVYVLEQEGHGAIIPIYLTLMESYLGGGYGWKHEWFFNPKMVVNELLALHELGDFGGYAFEFAKALLEKSAWFHEKDGVGTATPQFTKEQINTASNIHNLISIPMIIESLQGSGMSDDDIKKVLVLPRIYKGRLSFKQIVDVVIASGSIQKNFKGGISKFIRYLEGFDGMSRCQKTLIENIGAWNMSEEMRATYIKCADKLKAYMGDEMCIFFKEMPKDATPEKLEGRMEKVQNATEEVYETIGEERKKGWHMRDDIFDILIQCEEEEIDEVAQALIILTTHIETTKTRDKDAAETMNWHMRILGEFEKIMGERKQGAKAFRQWAEAIVKIYTVTRDYGERMRRSDLYRKLIASGITEEIAGHIGVIQEGKNVPMEMPASGENSQEIVEIAWWVQKLQNEHRDKSLANMWGSLQRMLHKSHQAVVPSLTDAYRDFDISKLKSQQRTLEALQKQWEEKGEIKLGKVINDSIETLKRIIADINIARAMEGGFGIGMGIVKAPSDFMRRAHPETKVAIQGAALTQALAGRKLSLNDPENLDLMSEHLGRSAQFIPHFERSILERRATMPGLMPLGAKLHLKEAPDMKRLEYILTHMLPYSHTPFQLTHAGKTIIIPPMPTSLESSMLIATLSTLGLLDEHEIDMQTAIGNRLTARTASIIGATRLLATRSGVQYAPGAFSSTHDNLTGKRIMLYDSGVRRSDLPYDIREAKGRTDMLGSRNIEDGQIYQLLGTLGSHRDTEGYFARLMESYENGFKWILRQHRLEQVPNQSAWIFDHATPDDTLENHEAMIRTLTQAWLENAQRPDLGIIGQVRKLIVITLEEFMRQGQKLAKADPLAFEKLMQF